jgi:hypothetical protein
MGRREYKNSHSRGVAKSISGMLLIDALCSLVLFLLTSVRKTQSIVMPFFCKKILINIHFNSVRIECVLPLIKRSGTIFQHENHVLLLKY